MTNRILTPINLVLITVANENTLNRPNDQFGALERGKKNIANTAKQAQYRLIRGASKEML
jgi:hypothetical protein